MAADLHDVSLRTAAASGARNAAGYLAFALGGFTFSRNETHVRIGWRVAGRPAEHTLPADAFLRALMRDVAWSFFYGWVDFDGVFGTRNRYDQVEVYAGRYSPSHRERGLDLVETFPAADALDVFAAMLRDWTNCDYDPFAAPAEAGAGWRGRKHGDNTAAIERPREACRRMAGLPGDLPLRADPEWPINRAFRDVPQDEPIVQAEPGFEHEVHAFNLFAYLSRSSSTWNPSVSSVCGHSLFCPTTEEDALPIRHANDRIEWFLQLSDSIEWHIEDRESGALRARVTMRAGDVAAMPADVRHHGVSPKRSMLLVWENADPALPSLYESGALPASPADEF